jgi:hypothetical protein
MIDIWDLLKIAKDAKSLFDGVKGKLLGQPDEAAQKLALVFEEINKIFLFIDAAMVNYLRLYIAPDRSNVVDCRSVLLGIEGGQLPSRAMKRAATATKSKTSTTNFSSAGSTNC